jgi:hypothetical protein
MNHAQISEYAMRKPGTSLRYPFDPLLPVIFVGSKMFALLGVKRESERVNSRIAGRELAFEGRIPRYYHTRLSYEQTALEHYYIGWYCTRPFIAANGR